MNSVVELPSNAIQIQTGAKKQFRLNIESGNTIQYTPNNEFIPPHPPNDVYTPPIIEPCDIISSHIDEPAQKQGRTQTEGPTEINTAPDLDLPIKPTIKYNIKSYIKIFLMKRSMLINVIIDIADNIIDFLLNIFIIL